MYSAIITLALATVAAAAPAAQHDPIGCAIVSNNCPFPVTLWSIGSAVSAPSTLTANGGSYTEEFTHDPQTGGRALKITKEVDGLYTGKPQTIFAYNLDASQVWYDLSDVFGDAFAGSKLVEKSDATECPAIVWDTGVPPAGSQVKVCRANADVTLTLCA